MCPPGTQVVANSHWFFRGDTIHTASSNRTSVKALTGTSSSALGSWGWVAGHIIQIGSDQYFCWEISSSAVVLYCRVLHNFSSTAMRSQGWLLGLEVGKVSFGRVFMEGFCLGWGVSMQKAVCSDQVFCFVHSSSVGWKEALRGRIYRF